MTSISSSSRKHDEAFDFFVPFSTGYVLFLTITILLGFFFAIFWGYYARCHDAWASRRLASPCQQNTRHLLNAVLMFSFEASVALLTWAGSIYSTTYDRGNTEGPIIGLPGILVGTMLLWIPLACLTDFLYIRAMGSARTIIVLFGVFLTTMLAVLPGFTMLTVYCKQMALIEDFTYYGPMIVATDISVESFQMRGHFAQLRTSDHNKDAYIHIAMPTVYWGLEWGCPDQPSTWCSTSLFETDCVRCEGRMKEQGFACLELGTEDDAKQCVADKFGIPKGLEGEGMDPAFTTIISEWEQSQFDDKASNKQLYIYGNCQNCDAIGTKSYEYLIRHNQSLKSTGIGLIVLALCMYCGLFLWVVVSEQLQKGHGDEESSSSSSVEDEDEYSNSEELSSVSLSSHDEECTDDREGGDGVDPPANGDL
jgi:hypothetical protein